MVKAITLKSRLRQKDVLRFILFMTQQWFVVCMEASGSIKPFLTTVVFFLSEAKSSVAQIGLNHTM